MAAGGRRFLRLRIITVRQILDGDGGWADAAAEIFESGFLTDHPWLRFAHMNVLLDHDAEDAEDQITYLYRMELGRSTSSFGTWFSHLLLFLFYRRGLTG